MLLRNKEKMKVFLLGAGASKSYAESPTGQRIPIANDFFNTFTKLKISENPFVIIGAIVYYIESKKNISILDYFNGNNNIEEFHTEIEQECLSKRWSFPKYFDPSSIHL